MSSSASLPQVLDHTSYIDLGQQYAACQGDEAACEEVVKGSAVYEAASSALAAAAEVRPDAGQPAAHIMGAFSEGVAQWLANWTALNPNGQAAVLIALRTALQESLSYADGLDMEEGDG